MPTTGKMWITNPGNNNWAFNYLKAQFGIGEELIEMHFRPYVYVNQDAIKANKLDQATVERATALEISQFKGVALAVSNDDLSDNSLPEMPLLHTERNNFNPKRSGDIFVVFEPYRFFNGFDGLTVAATHSSQWNYDT